MKDLIKKSVFTIHNYSRYYILYGWAIHRNVLKLQLLVMLSWYLNNNKCLICQIEKYFFGETLLENNSVYVDRFHREELYSSFIIGFLARWFIKVSRK